MNCKRPLLPYFLLLGGLLSFSSPGADVLVDFEGLTATGILSGGVDLVPVPDSVLTDDFINLGVVFGRDGLSQGVAVAVDSFAPSSGVNSVVGLNADGNIPGSTGGGAAVGDIYFRFVVPGTTIPAATDLVSFTLGDGGGDDDVFQIRVLDLGDSVIQALNVSGAARFPVTIAMPGIQRVEVLFQGDFGYSLDDLGFRTPQGGRSARIDIKPGSCPNAFNRGSNGVLPVALVGSLDLDVSRVELASLQLSRADGVGGSVAPLDGPPGPHAEFEDVATPFPGDRCGCHELAGDGIVDLSLKFRSQDLVAALELGALPRGSAVELVLTGSLGGGTSFSAGDCLRLVPPSGGLNLTVESSLPNAFIDVSPLDEMLEGGGFGTFVRSFPRGTVVRLEAPRQMTRVFLGWAVFVHPREPALGSRPGGTFVGSVSSPVLELPILFDGQKVEALFLEPSAVGEKTRR